MNTNIPKEMTIVFSPHASTNSMVERYKRIVSFVKTTMQHRPPFERRIATEELLDAMS